MAVGNITGKLLLSVLILIAPALMAQKSAINSGLLAGAANQQSSLVLTEVPLGLVGVQDMAVIQWAPAASGDLRYSSVPGGGNPVNYPATLPGSSLSVNRNGEIQFLGEKIPAGVHYCIVTSGSDHSTEFMLVRESEISPRLISPRSARGAQGINTNSPVFTWEEVNGVPFYHIFLSDQPFTVSEDEDGNTETEGANVIWQAITSETSISYGTPDPSNYFTITAAPPLVKGVRYNWVVVNNYGNNPALSSSVTSGPTGFNVAVEPPFAPPQPIHPAFGATVSSDIITFQWSEVEDASLYHVYLSRLEELDGSEALLPIWDGVTSNTLYDVSASVLQQEGHYYWKVLAQNAGGNGAMTDTTRFFFTTRSALVNFYTVDLQGRVVPRSTLTLESVTHGSNPLVLPTDANGAIDRLLPLGSYAVTAAKEGFEDTTIVFTLNVEDETRNLNIPMRQSPSRIYGSTRDGQTALGFVTLRATSQSTGEVRQTSSDLNGNFSLSLTSDNWTLRASKSGYAAAPARSLFVGPGVNLNLDESGGGPFVLSRNTFTLSGFAVTPAGEAIWGATVTAAQGSQIESILSNSQGQYSVALGPGVWTVAVSKAGYVSSQPQQVTIIDHNLSLNLTLTPKANIISGAVTSNNVPLENARVLAVPASGATKSATTNAFGQYTFSLGRGAYQIAPAKQGYVSPEPEQFALTVGQTLSGIDFALRPETSFITGEVTSDGVSPLAGVSISNGDKTTKSDANGRYTLGLLQGTHTLSASKQGHLANGSQTVTLTPGQTLSGINFVLSPNASVIRGAVTNGSLPVSCASIMARNRQTGAQHSVQTDENGAYSLSVPAGAYSVAAAKRGFISTPDSSVVTVNPGQTSPNHHFNFMENKSYVAGLVQSSTSPVRNASVRVTAMDAGHSFSTMTGVNGDFNISVLPGYAYTVRVSKAGYFEKDGTTSRLSVSETASLTLTLTPHQSLITGRVLNQNGHALAQATVKANGAASEATTTTDASGNFQLGVAAGAYELAVQKSGYLPATRTLSIGVGDTLSANNFSLTANFAALDGRLTDATSGDAIANALVVATEASSGDGGSDYSGEQGRYLIQNLPVGVYAVTVSHPSYLSRNISNQVIAGGSANRIDLVLTPKNGVITGRVTDGDAGVAGVTITATTSGISASTVSGSAGQYSISNLAPASYTMQASLTGYSSSAAQTVALSSNQSITTDFTVTANKGQIAGRVLEDGIGLSGASVTAIGVEGNTGFATTNTSGSYTLSNLAADTYTVRTNLDHYSSTPDSVVLEIAAGASRNQDFAVTRSAVSITGRVTDQAGHVLANIPVIGESAKGAAQTITDANGIFHLSDLAPEAQYRLRTDIFQEGYDNAETSIQVRGDDIDNAALAVGVHKSAIRGNVGISEVAITATHAQRDMSYTTTSQPDGSFLLKHLYDGDYTLTVSKVGYRATPAQKSVAGLAISETRSGVNFQLEALRITISGRVLDTAGEPIPNASVRAWSPQASSTGTSEDDGSYTVTDLPPNLTYTVQTRLSDLDYDNASLSVSAGENNLTGQTLTVQVHNSVIAGAVSDGSGSPVANARVTITELDSVAYTDQAGAYYFEHIAAGIYTLTVNKAGFAPGDPVAVQIGRDAVVTKDFANLTPLASAIFGVVNDADGRLEAATVSVLEPDGASVGQDTTDGGGIYHLAGLDVNKQYTVTVSRTGYQTASRSAVGLAEGSAAADFTLAPKSNSIFGRVMSQTSGEVVAGARVTINGLAGGVWRDSTDSFGLFSVSGLLGGGYSVLAEHDTLVSQSQTVELTSGSASKLKLKLEKAGAIAGQVTYLGAGRAGANITATNPLSGVVATTTSTADGSFRLKGLINGDYAVSCVIAGFAAEPSPQLVTVRSGEVAAADFVLSAENNAILGTVTDEAENFVPGVKIRLGSATLQDSTISNRSAQFQFAGLEDGTYQVEASLAGYVAPPAETIELVGGEPVVMDIKLTAIQNSISGFVQDGRTGGRIPAARVTAIDANSAVRVDTSAADGSYLFELDKPGNYVLNAQKTGYETGGAVEVNLQNGKSVAQNLVLTPIISLSSLSGTVTRRGQAVAAAEVRCLSLTDVSVRDTVQTDAAGRYAFFDLPAPAEYLLEVAKADLPILSSSLLELTAADLNYDFIFPSATLKWTITRDGVTPAPGVTVRINNDTRDIHLITNNEGKGATPDDLAKGEYFITLEQDGDAILPARYSISLPDDSTTVVQDIWLPFMRDAADSVSAEEALTVKVRSFVTPEDTLWLFYKGPGEVGFSRLEMPLQSSASPDSLIYAAAIPPRGAAGVLSYFVETNFRGHHYSGASQPHEATVTNQGILSLLNLSPPLKNVPPGVPVVLQARAYDGINKPMAPETIDWQITSGQGVFEQFSPDSTTVWFVSRTDTTSQISVQIGIDDVTLARKATVVTESRVLGALEVTGSGVETSNADPVTFTYSAADTAGTLMAIYPLWHFEPANSGQLIRSTDLLSAVFQPASGFIGQVKITVRDSLTGAEAEFNSAEGVNAGDTGLKVYQIITASSSETQVSDGQGFSLTIPEGVVESGARLKVKLRRPSVPDVKRFTGKYTVAGQIYDILVSGSLRENKQFRLRFPIPDGMQRDRLAIGHWDLNTLSWQVIESAIEGESLVATTSHFSEFAVLQQSEPLGISKLQLKPNPFTPHDPYGLQLGFNLTSDDIRKPWVTVKIYNMRGDLVRVLADDLPMAPIEYLPGDESTLSWDGLTDSGTLAQNGRYIVRIKVQDSTGAKEAIKTVVLIK